MFTMGLTFTCPAGIHMFTLFNSSAPSWNLLLLALVEVVVVGWIYGSGRLLRDLDEMGMNIHPAMKIYWTACWKVVTPSVLVLLLCFSLSNFGHVSYEEYSYPISIQVLGYLVTGCTLVWIPIFLIIEIHRKRKSDEAYPLLTPTKHWGRETCQEACKEEDEEGQLHENAKDGAEKEATTKMTPEKVSNP